MTAKTSTKITMATAKKMWLDIATREALSASKFRAERAEVVRKLSVAGYGDTAIAKGLGITVGETGKLLASAMAQNIGKFDILATLDAINDKDSNATAGKIKGIANSKMKRDEKVEALKELGLKPSENRATRKARVTTVKVTPTSRDLETIKKIVERVENQKTNADEIWTALQDAADRIGGLTHKG